MKKIISTENQNDLFAAVLSLRSVEEAGRFFRDLLTEAELREFSARYKAAKMLYEGIPYTDIVAETGLSSTTVARVSKWLKKGMKGYQLVIKRSLPSSHHLHTRPVKTG